MRGAAHLGKQADVAPFATRTLTNRRELLAGIAACHLTANGRSRYVTGLTRARECTLGLRLTNPDPKLHRLGPGSPDFPSAGEPTATEPSTGNPHHRSPRLAS
jgi:hypothetical protein